MHRPSLRIAPLTSAVGLAGLSALHVAWARGSHFPAASGPELSALVAGIDPLQNSGHGTPHSQETYAVAGLLGVAAGAITLAGFGLGGRRVRQVVTIAGASLVARSALGFAADKADYGNMTPQFRTWNRRLYSPLAGLLGIGALTALVTGRKRRHTA